MFEPENMKVNVTLEEGDSVDNYNSEKDEIDPNGLWVVRTVLLSDLVSQECYSRIFKDE